MSHIIRSEVPVPGQRFPALHGARHKRGRLVAIALVIGVVLLLTALGLNALLGGAAPSSRALGKSAVFGHVYFESSEQLSGYSSQGICDEVHIDLAGIAPPAPGMSYYGWLIGGSVEGRAIPLGRLPFDQGRIRSFYPGEQAHTNLLLVSNRFLITEESAAYPPVAPSPDASTWRYMAGFSLAPNPQEIPHYSLFDHLHHVLADDPTLDEFQLSGGLAIWLFRDTQKLLEWTGSAQGAWGTDPGLIHRQLVRILDYLDGSNYVREEPLPPGTPLLVDRKIGQVGLLEFDVQGQNPPGYLYHIGLHLRGIEASPAATSVQRRLASSLDVRLNRVGGWFLQLRGDAERMVGMQPAQLALRSSLTALNEMRMLAEYAFSGRMDPASGKVQEGVIQMYNEMGGLATLDVTSVSPGGG